MTDVRTNSDGGATVGLDPAYDKVKRDREHAEALKKAKAKAKGSSAGFQPIEIVLADDIDIAAEIAAPGTIDGLTGTTGLFVTYGAPGAGKTFYTVDRACHVALGWDWQGHSITKSFVVYIAAENPASIRKRIAAWKLYHKVESVPVAILQSAVNLCDPNYVDHLITELQDLEKRLGKKIGYIVDDTLARSMLGDENSARDMGAFVAACFRLAAVFNCVVNAVHHTGKDESRGSRGSSALVGGTDLEEEVVKGCATLTKTRDGEEDKRYGFKLDIIELGRNLKGRMVTTCIAIATEPPKGKGKTIKLGPNETIVIRALRDAIFEHGNNDGRVTIDRWREEATMGMTHATKKERDRAFREASASLTAKEIVTVYGEYAGLGKRDEGVV